MPQINRNMRMVWNGGRVQKRIHNNLMAKGRRIAMHLERRVKQNINTGQPTEGSGRNRRGLNPSKPGQFPKKVTARLQTSIRGRVTQLPDRVRVKVGTNVVYARHLETGDRSFLMRTVREEGSKIASIMRGV